MENGEWRMENRKWRMENGECKMQNAEWYNPHPPQFTNHQS
jgi:hypothetical protein